MNRTGETKKKKKKLTGKGRMLIVENSLHGNDVDLNKIGVRVLTQWSGAILTAYAAPPPTPDMIVIMTCSLTVNGPGLREIPKRETFGT